ncbi:hypothetical protein HMPREF1624_07815 [Sporothrix schenckii ATCC 58251]|uniref:Uncharacterized protein n=1 Tax=Sporothrix schenckii (strain ATCC 58251 / de Perez 2211183) TaxID=1391915 RepID=U7PMK0_SPOS1|nr:hypothetical protein HMPREF1624_07815 [Sporothrix schenckii ATCC 58251]
MRIGFDGHVGHGPLRVPGCGYPVIAERAVEQRFAHGFHDWAQDRVTEREVHMLRYMNYVTDQPGWHDAVLHDKTDADGLARWEREAVAKWPLLSPRALAWCRAELRDKAKQFAATGGGLVTVFNAGARVCKADGLLAPALLRRLAAHVEALAHDHDQETQWGPQRVQRQRQVVRSDSHLNQESDSETNDDSGADRLAGPSGAETQTTVQATPGLVDPNWLPLVYGQTPVLAQGGRVGCAGAVDAMGRGVLEPLPVYRWPRHLERPRRGGWRPVRDGRGRRLYDGLAYRFSPRFQWLPCEVQFAPAREPPVPGHADRPLGVRITSYINNLHPVRHHALYRDIGACIAAAIPAWNEVLMLRSKGPHPWHFQGRDPPRIRTFGVTWSPPRPAWAAGLAAVDTAADKGTPEYQAARAQVLAYLREPENPLAARTPWYEPNLQVRHTLSHAMKQKHGYITAWEHPEPGVAFTYEQWKAGHASVPVVPPPEEERVDLADHKYYTVSLADTFQAQGIQVVVEIGSLELCPGDVPPRDPWTLTGTLNDHIVATAVVYFASDNVTADAAGLDVRVEADIEPPIYSLDTWAGAPYHSSWPLADVYGVVPEPAHGQVAPDFSARAPPVQELGTVVEPDGRLVVWPNAVQHRVRPLALRDPTRPGRRRFLKLHLVDPHYRVVSTRNVPPQQRAWWAAAGWDRIDWAARGLPPELVGMIGNDVFAAPWPPAPEEARRLWTRARREQAAVRGATFSKMYRSRFEE